MNAKKPIVLDRNSISIMGKRKILLCASLFYFRIPAELWRDRIQKLKLAGYNCADVYFPWNFHELSPGEWTFEAERDVNAFLSIMAEEGLYVVARPGPYICSEWDGGSIPGWLLADGTEIRSGNPRWLSAVRGWYSRIIPILARHQIHHQGSIILFQVENELDFFDCPNPGSYMAKLSAMAREFGIEVPVFGCAGQGSVAGATGWADDVVPTFNFYPSAFEPSFDPVCLTVHKALQEKNLPLLITETGREHFLLRREMASGARLLGAYNQVGGTNFGFTASINNWGKGSSPLSFLSTDYDFDSMIDPMGRFRVEALEGRLLGGLLDALGAPLATAAICDEHPCVITWSEPHEKNKGNGSLLDMGRAGALLCVPNFSNKAEKATVSTPFGTFTAFIGGYHAPFFPLNLDLWNTGCNGDLVYASAEILKLSDGEIILYADVTRASGSGQGCDPPEAMLQENGGARTLVSGYGRHQVKMGGRTLQVIILDREAASCLDIGRGAMTFPVSVPPGIMRMPAGSKRRAFPEKEWLTPRTGKDGIHMEACGLPRGTATYRVDAKAGADILLKGVADIVQGWRADIFQGCRVSGGQWQLFQSTADRNPDMADRDPDMANRNPDRADRNFDMADRNPDMADRNPDASGMEWWQFRTDSWGHSNFDDARLPSMRIASPKGICGLYQVNRTDASGLMWRFQIQDAWLPDRLEAPMDPMAPILPPNAWNSTRMPLIASYTIHWTLQEDSDACVMELCGPEAETAIYVDGCPAGVYNAFDPWIDLSVWFKPGQTRAITLLCRKRHWAEPAGVPRLHHLTKLHPEIAGCSDREMESYSRMSPSNETAPDEAVVDPSVRELPLVPGETLLLRFPLDSLLPADGKQAPCLQARIKGREMKAIGLFNGHLLGRIFGKSACRPDFVGGDPELLYLPGPWFKEKDNLLLLVVEGIGEGAILDSVRLEK